METTSAHYQKDTAEISVHVQDSQKDIPVFSHISEELLVEKVRQIFLYSLHDKTISQFRRMMTLEQFRSPKFAELLSKRYVDWMISYHAGIFRALVANGELRNETLIRWRGCMFLLSSSCSVSATASRNGKLKALKSWTPM